MQLLCQQVIAFFPPPPSLISLQATLLVYMSAKLDPACGRYTKMDIYRAMVCVSLNSFFTDELTQVNGLECINDFTGISLKHQTMFSIEDQKSFYGGWNVRYFKRTTAMLNIVIA